METIPRRQFLFAAGYLSIGFSLFGCSMKKNQGTPVEQKETLTFAEPLSPLSNESQIDAWLRVWENGRVQILTGKMELGQGVRVVMQQVAGEELNIHPLKIEVVLADTGRTQNEGYTAGSRSVESSAMIVRNAAAAAREQLIQLAAAQWNIAGEFLLLDDGFVERTDTHQRLSFSDLLKGKQLDTEIPQIVSLKPKEHYQWVGKSIPHSDLEKIVRGEVVYIQDMRLPDMLHARVVRPPAYGAKLESWDKSLELLPGVLKIVENGSFLGVISTEEYQAVRAAEWLREKTQWTFGTAFPAVSSWAEYLKDRTDGTEPDLGDSPNQHHAIYSKPYVMHGSIGPSCAIAAFSQGRLHIWSHTQGVYPLRSTISNMTGLAEDRIRITGVRGSGCYGHNGADDVAADAALLAMAFPDRPIRLQWQRWDEHRWEPYGSAMRMELFARLNAEGKIEQWSYQLWSDSHSTRPRGDAGNLVTARYLAEPFPFRLPNSVGGGTRNSEPYYRIPKMEVKNYYVNGPLRSSALRSLGAYANIFAIESFMEELAEKTNSHPLDFRLAHLEDDRAIQVIRTLKSMLEGIALLPGEGLGYGFSRYKNTASYCAVAAKVKVELTARKVSPIKMWAVLDAGEAINPDGLKNQTEGGMIQSASWTLKEAVLFDHREIVTKDWGSYPIIRYDLVPETEVIVIDRPDQPALGAGEAAQGPAAAAIANAVYAACGKRIRHLPLEKGLFG